MALRIDVIKALRLTNDVSLCDKMKGNAFGRDECYKDIAINTNNASICDKIENRELRGDCYDS